MVKVLLYWIVGIACCLSATPAGAQSLIIDHDDVALFDSIPIAYKEAAAQQRMVFMDRSVGFNISTYLDCLAQPWASAPNACKRYQHLDSLYTVSPSEVYWSDTWDRTQWRYAFWPDNCSEDVTCFIGYVEERLDSFDMMGCQFSYLAFQSGSPIADPETGFFGAQGGSNSAATYAEFMAQHPDKRVIWWTTSLARAIGTTESESFNAQMRAYANTHDIILFDVADILAHDPDGLSCFDNRDGIAYRTENHPDDGLDIPAICPHYTTETEGGHLGSVSAGGIRVAKALWVLMARLAGWEQEITAVHGEEVISLQVRPNPATERVWIQWGAQDLHLPADIRLMDMHGTVVRHEILSPGQGSDEFSFSLSALPPGVYAVWVRVGEQTSIRPLMIY